MSTTTSGWQLQRIAGPEVEPLSLEQARMQLKLDPDLTDENDLITDHIKGAREQCEDFCQRTFCESTWRYSLDAFPFESYYGNQEAIVLPMGPVIEIVSFGYVDQQGLPQALDPLMYRLATSGPREMVFPAPWNTSWPFARCGSVAIEYRAGYPGAGSPPGAENVPARVRQTMRSIITRWFEKRDQVDVDDLLMAGLWQLRVIA